jgi:ABC-type sugar transport system ATPase subunit
MNFLRGDMAGGVFRHPGGEVPLGDHVDESVRDSNSAVSEKLLHVWLGFRPEDVAVHGEGPPLGRVELEVVEQMGHESMGYFQLGGARYALRLAADSGLSPGDQIEPRLRPGSWRLFIDDAGGKRL